MFLKVPAEKKSSALYLSTVKEHNMAIVTSRFYPRPLLLPTFANIEALSASRSGTGRYVSLSLNFSLWVAEVLALELKYRGWPQDKTRPKLLLHSI